MRRSEYIKPAAQTKKEFAIELFREARIRKNNYLSAPLRACGAFLFYRKFKELSYRIKKYPANPIRNPLTGVYDLPGINFFLNHIT